MKPDNLKLSLAQSRLIKPYRESGQAFVEMIVFIGVVLLLVTAVRVFARIAAADENQIAEARWLTFHCAYREIHCNALPETHGSVDSLLGQELSRRLAASEFDAGASLLQRYASLTSPTHPPESIAKDFSYQVRDGIRVAEVTSTFETNAREIELGLPGKLVLAPRRLASLAGTWNLDADENGEAETIQRAARGVSLPGQSVIDGLLSINQSLRDFLQFFGLESIKTNWSAREVRPLPRTISQDDAQRAGCPECQKNP